MEEILVVAFCLVLNALFAAFEMAFVSISRGRLRVASRQGSKDAQWILKRRENPERTLSVIQIGITLVTALAAAVGGVGAAESIQPYFMKNWSMGEVSAELLAVVMVVLPLTYLSVVLGELVPKSLALRAPLPIVLKGTKWLYLADRVLSPAVSILEWSTRKILNAFFPRSKTAESPSATTTLEIDSLVPSHQEAVINFAHIERRTCLNFMLPWEEVNFVKSTDPLSDVIAMVFASGHTRLPVVDFGEVSGILHTKEFLAYRENGGTDWLSIIRPVLKVQGKDTAISILRQMQSLRSHMAIVLSADNERLGIVTMEDILEEFLGEIYDEDEDSRIRKIFANKVKSREVSS